MRLIKTTKALPNIKIDFWFYVLLISHFRLLANPCPEFIKQISGDDDISHRYAKNRPDIIDPVNISATLFDDGLIACRSLLIAFLYTSNLDLFTVQAW